MDSGRKGTLPPRHFYRSRRQQMRPGGTEAHRQDRRKQILPRTRVNKLIIRVQFLEASALTNFNVQDAFSLLLKNIIIKIDNGNTNILYNYQS